MIPAGGLKVRSNDCDYVFRPHTAFVHLTGLDEVGDDPLNGALGDAERGQHRTALVVAVGAAVQAAILRGDIVHRLMQSLPDIPKERRIEAAHHFWTCWSINSISRFSAQ